MKWVTLLPPPGSAGGGEKDFWLLQENKILKKNYGCLLWIWFNYLQGHSEETTCFSTLSFHQTSDWVRKVLI